MNLRFLLISETLGMEGSGDWGCYDFDNIPLPVKIIVLILSIILLLCTVALLVVLLVYIWTGYDFTCINNNVEVEVIEYSNYFETAEVIEYSNYFETAEVIEYSNYFEIAEVIEYSNYFEIAVNNFHNYKKQIDYIASKDNHSDAMLRLCNLYKSKANHPALRYLTNHIVPCDECYIKFYGGE